MAVIGWGGFSLAIHAVKECNPSLICDASVFIKGTVGRVSSLVFKKKKSLKIAVYVQTSLSNYWLPLCPLQLLHLQKATVNGWR